MTASIIKERCTSYIFAKGNKTKRRDNPNLRDSSFKFSAPGRGILKVRFLYQPTIPFSTELGRKERCEAS